MYVYGMCKCVREGPHACEHTEASGGGWKPHFTILWCIPWVGGLFLNFLPLFPWFCGTGAHAAASGSLYGFWESQPHVYKTSALIPDPSFQSLNLNLISHDAYETNITKLHTDPNRNYDAPQPRAVEGKIWLSWGDEQA